MIKKQEDFEDGEVEMMKKEILDNALEETCENCGLTKGFHYWGRKESTKDGLYCHDGKKFKAKQETCENCEFGLDSWAHILDCEKFTPKKGLDKKSKDVGSPLAKRIYRNAKVREEMMKWKKIDIVDFLIDFFIEKEEKHKEAEKNHSPQELPTALKMNSPSSVGVIGKEDMPSDEISNLRNYTEGTSKSKPILPKTIADGIEKEGTSKSK